MTGQRRRREFPEAFKRQAVERVRTSGLSNIAVAKELDVHETVLRRWIQRYGETGATPAKRAGVTAAAAGPSPADLAAENARLKRENARLQTERDILRKAAFAGGSLFGASRRGLDPDEVRVRGRAQGRLADLCHVPRAGGVCQRLLRLAIPTGEPESQGRPIPSWRYLPYS